MIIVKNRNKLKTPLAVMRRRNVMTLFDPTEVLKIPSLFELPPFSSFFLSRDAFSSSHIPEAKPPPPFGICAGRGMSVLQIDFGFFPASESLPLVLTLSVFHFLLPLPLRSEMALDVPFPPPP